MLCVPAVLMGGGAGKALCSTPTRPVGLEQAPDPAQPYGAGMPLSPDTGILRVGTCHVGSRACCADSRQAMHGT